MQDRKSRIPPEIYRAIWSTVWIFILSAPFIFYEAHQAQDRSLGVLAAVTVALLPLVSTIANKLWRLFHKTPSEDTGNIAANSTAYSFLLFTAACLYFIQEQQQNEHHSVHILIFWMVVGVVLAIVGVRYFKSWHDPKTLRFLFLSLACALLNSWRGMNNKDLGKAGMAIGPMMLAGLGLGYLIHYAISHIVTHARRVGRDLVKYRWEFATFVSGYLMIIYIFASLAAMLWAMNTGNLDMGSLGQERARAPNFGDFLYFSILTLSTLGGDIKPVTPLAKTLTAAEVLVGIFWITVVFSRLSEYAAKPALDSDDEK